MAYAELAHFGNYAPSNFGWADQDPEQDTSLLVPFTYKGADFGTMHRDAVGVFTAVLDALVPVIAGTPNPVNGECGCYNPNSVTVDGQRSFHTYGIAIDVNWTQNPMYAPTHPTGPHTLPLATSGIAHTYGCEWGGDWTYPQDWMHIEVHLTPDVARTVTATPTPAPPSEEDDDMANYPYIICDAANTSRAALVDAGGVSLIRSNTAVLAYRGVLKVPTLKLDTATFNARIQGAK